MGCSTFDAFGGLSDRSFPLGCRTSHCPLWINGDEFHAWHILMAKLLDPNAANG